MPHKNQEECFGKTTGSAYPKDFKINLEGEIDQTLGSNPKHKPQDNQSSSVKEYTI